MKRRAALVVLLVLLCGCSRQEAPLDRPVPQATPRARELPPPVSSSSEVKDPVFSVGQEAFITSDGMVPQQLVAIVGERISFVNETSKPRTIEFDVLEWDSGPIAPGAAATFTPDGAYAIAYHVGEKPEIRGQVQVEPYFGPGEDPAAPTRLDADTPGDSR